VTPLEEVLVGTRPWHVEQGDVLTVLRAMPANSVQVCATSPPYWGLRDYGLPPSVWGGDPDCDHEWGAHEKPKPGRGNKPGDFSTSSLTNPARQDEVERPKTAGQFCRLCGAWLGCLGLEPTPALYVEHITAVFREVRRVLRPDGTCWVNLGDSYAGSWGAQSRPGYVDSGSTLEGGSMLSARQIAEHPKTTQTGSLKRTPGLKNKDLIGVPWRVAFSLQDDGWYLRSAITWCKKACMPESIKDRPTSATEMIFLFAKSERYFYDHGAVKEESVSDHRSGNGYARPEQMSRGGRGQDAGWEVQPTRNLRNYWLLSSEPLTDDHYAAWPTEIPRRAILAGSRPGDIALDIFSGSGRTGIVALELGRRYVGIELSDYQAAKSRQRIVNAHGVEPERAAEVAGHAQLRMPDVA
jgi:DNA modification methylase